MKQLNQFFLKRFSEVLYLDEEYNGQRLGAFDTFIDDLSDEK